MAHARIRSALQVLVLVLLGVSPAAAQSVASLFTSLPADFAHLFTPSSAIVIGVGAAGGAAIHPRDEEIASRIEAAEGTRPLFYRTGETLGDIPVQASIALSVYIVGRVRRDTELAALGADLVDAQIVNGVLTQGLKYAVDRTRPNGSGRSFPSGHTSATFATAAVIQQHYGWKAALPFYALGSYVGVSRMVTREHFASDVIFGAAVGMASGRAAAFGHGRNRVTISPALAPGGIIVVGTIGR